MKRSVNGLIGVILVLISNVSFAGFIEATFDNGNEGFRLSGDATTSFAQFSSSGFIFAVDRALGGNQFFEAPAQFLGDLSGAFNQTLSFDLNFTGSGAILASAANIFTIFSGTDSIQFVDNFPSRGVFRTYEAVLNESQGFRSSEGGLATDAFIQQVLSDVTRIRIRAEFINGVDTVRLDNFRIGVVPEPNGLLVMGLVLFAIARFARRSKKS
ncbi:hypothetical protein EYS14_22470 [Alteromonadaceae bacterium M269]|nr:hypothetical protein EYS14_22470 [Alteromonadaceae bacterium M269]